MAVSILFYFVGSIQVFTLLGTNTSLEGSMALEYINQIVTEIIETYDLKRLQSFAVTEHATFVLVRHCSLLVLEQLA